MTQGINQNDADMVQVSTGSQIGKEDKKAELERRREERRQVNHI